MNKKELVINLIKDYEGYRVINERDYSDELR